MLHQPNEGEFIQNKGAREYAFAHNFRNPLILISGIIIYQMKQRYFQITKEQTVLCNLELRIQKRLTETYTSDVSTSEAVFH